MHIYALMSGQLVLYVGKTADPKEREYMHRSKHNTSGSRHIPPYTDWNMKLLEKCSTELSKLREQYWMDQLKPLYNEKNAYKKKISIEEYKAYNREAQKRHQAKKKAENPTNNFIRGQKSSKKPRGPFMSVNSVIK